MESGGKVLSEIGLRPSDGQFSHWRKTISLALRTKFFHVALLGYGLFLVLSVFDGRAWLALPFLVNQVFKQAGNRTSPVARDPLGLRLEVISHREIQAFLLTHGVHYVRI